MGLKLYLYDNDITNSFFENQNFEIVKNTQGIFFFVSELNFNIHNTNDFFSIDGKFFSTRNWYLKAPIKLELDGITMWEGLLTNISNNSTESTVTLSAINKSFKNLD
jgi:hypothetical protein